MCKEYKNLWQTLADMIFPCLNFPASFSTDKILISVLCSVTRQNRWWHLKCQNSNYDFFFHKILDSKLKFIIALIGDLNTFLEGTSKNNLFFCTFIFCLFTFFCFYKLLFINELRSLESLESNALLEFVRKKKFSTSRESNLQTAAS